MPASPHDEGAPLRLIFLNRYFHPDHSATSQMLSDLAFALAARRLSVTIITSRQRYDAPDVELPARESMRGVEVHRVRMSRFGRQNLLGRAVDYMTFYVSTAWKLWRRARAGDIVIAKTDPPMLSVLAAPICRLRRATLVNWLQDIFPEVAEALGVGGGRLSRAAYSVMRALRNHSLQRASMNVALGARMAERLSALDVAADRIRIIPNWADGALVRPVEPLANALRRDWGMEHKFVVGYSGNLGRAHESETLLDAIERIEAQWRERNEATSAGPHTIGDVDERPDVVWLFIGGGVLYQALQAEVRRRGLTSVAFRPYQMRDRLAESLSAADVHLVSLRPGLEGLVVPSKIYGILAAGRPALFIGDKDGEIARLLALHQCGRTVARGDGAALARIILELAREPAVGRQMGERARALFDAAFGKEAAVASWARLMSELSTREGAHEVEIARQGGAAAGLGAEGGGGALARQRWVAVERFQERSNTSAVAISSPGGSNVNVPPLRTRVGSSSLWPRRWWTIARRAGSTMR